MTEQCDHQARPARASPEYGDITEDVARELARMTRGDDEQLAHTAYARQAAIVAARPGDGRIAGFALNSEGRCLTDLRFLAPARGAVAAPGAPAVVQRKSTRAVQRACAPTTDRAPGHHLPAYRVTGKRAAGPLIEHSAISTQPSADGEIAHNLVRWPRSLIPI